ncbi:unnamed protein product [Owenia fusiformis]|uniref:Carboxylic ester hydrolase n=1 Tax=Owenia fusiformis TaxID=6347 RepID=A0A8J1YAR6_OWEFU|nr:unnamed protein product [Owenia fusiformis]
MADYQNVEGIVNPAGPNVGNDYNSHPRIDGSLDRMNYEKPARRCSNGKLLGLAIFILLALGTIGVAVYLKFYTLAPEEVDKTNIDPLVIHTASGQVHGMTSQSPQGQQVQEYLGIPYAEPPVGDLRYAKPKPYGMFPNGTYNASSYRNSCFGFIDETFGDFRGSDMWNPKNPLSEDCLFLNIWVPLPVKQKRAVMVWVFGGGFYSGSSSLSVYDGKALAAHADVVVVSMNYRVGSFGFFSTGDDRSKGNFGLHDVLLSLKWINTNIGSFGGDKDSVTLFGESAGAATIGYMLMADEADPLFKRAILQSASPDSRWSYMTEEQAKERSQLFASAMTCKDNANLMECLRTKDADEIYAKDYVTGNFFEFPWVPNKDGELVEDNPRNLIKEGKFQKKDIIAGVNTDEGSFWILYALPGFFKDNSSEQSEQMYRDAIKTLDWDLPSGTKDLITTEYLPADTSDKNANRDAIEDEMGDRAFICPTINLAQDFSASNSGNTVYMYYLSHRASNEVWPEWMGTIHGADIQWIFGLPLDKSRGYTKEEEVLSKDIMTYWSNFAKTGNPNGAGLPEWPTYREDAYTHLEFREGNSQGVYPTGSKHREKYCTFWNSLP